MECLYSLKLNEHKFNDAFKFDIRAFSSHSHTETLTSNLYKYINTTKSKGNAAYKVVFFSHFQNYFLYTISSSTQ